MLLKDKQVIYITTPRTEIMHGQSITTWEKLRKIYANVQYMSNEDEQREFGTVTNSIIIIRISGYVDKDIVKGIEPKDGIYLRKPIPLPSPEPEEPDENESNVGESEIIESPLNSQSEFIESTEKLPEIELTYPAPDYVIFDVKSSYVTAKNDPHKFTSTLRNPLIIKAQLNEGKRK